MNEKMSKDELSAVRTLVKMDDRFRQFLPEIGVPVDGDEGITLGMSKRKNLPVSINPQGSCRILTAGASGTGKSFISNRIVNKALEHGYRVVVLDIRGEYRKCNMANTKHAKYLFSYEVPHGMPDVVQLIPEFCRKDMSPLELKVEKNRAVFFSLSPSQIPPHILRRLLNLRETDAGYFLLESALAELPPNYTLNDLKAKINDLPTTEEVPFQDRTKRVVLNRIAVMEKKKVISNMFFDLKKTLKEYNLVFNFMYSEDEYIMKVYVGAIVAEVYKYAKRGGISKSVLLVVDEADLLLSRLGWSESKKELLKIIKLGRLYNISTIFISQTPSLLPGLIISQSNYLVVGALKDADDAAWLCKSRGLDPRRYRNTFINQDPTKFEFAFVDDRRRGYIEHFYAKSCLSQHDQPFKR